MYTKHTADQPVFQKIFEQINRNRKLFFKVLLIVFILAVAAGLRIHQSKTEAVTIKQDSSHVKESAPVSFYVDISGAVNSPGVYKANEKTRLFQVIEKAGGLSEDADIDAVNQASFVKDGDKILIPSKSQSSDSQEGSSGGDEGITADGKVNLNKATKEQLMSLNGIGQVMADRILEYRGTSRFESVEDLKSVKGIGTVTFNNLKDHVTV